MTFRYAQKLTEYGETGYNIDKHLERNLFRMRHGDETEFRPILGMNVEQIDKQVKRFAKLNTMPLTTKKLTSKRLLVTWLL